MFGIGNWIKETTTTSGTGNITLSSVTGYDTFGSQFGDATTNTPARYFQYTIKDGNNWETGIGHMSTTTVLVRDVIQMTLTAGSMARYGSALTLSGGSCDVFCDLSVDMNLGPYCQGAASTSQGVPFMRHGTATTTQALAANFAFMWPIYLPLAGVYTGIRDHVSATAGTKYQWGIYSVGTDGFPLSLLARTADITPATGNNQRAWNASATVFLHVGYYYLVWSGDGAITVNTMQIYGQNPWFVSGVEADGSGQVGRSAALASPLPAAYSSFAAPSWGGTSQKNIPLVEFTRSV